MLKISDMSHVIGALRFQCNLLAIADKQIKFRINLLSNLDRAQGKIQTNYTQTPRPGESSKLSPATRHVNENLAGSWFYFIEEPQVIGI